MQCWRSKSKCKAVSGSASKW